MAAGEKLDLSITGLSYKVTTVKEMWYLVGSVEGINKKELLLECQIAAEFVDPKIEVSSSVIDFQYDYGPYSEFYKLTGKNNIQIVIGHELPSAHLITFAFLKNHFRYSYNKKCFEVTIGYGHKCQTTFCNNTETKNI